MNLLNVLTDVLGSLEAANQMELGLELSGIETVLSDDGRIEAWRRGRDELSWKGLKFPGSATYAFSRFKGGDKLAEVETWMRDRIAKAERMRGMTFAEIEADWKAEKAMREDAMRKLEAAGFTIGKFPRICVRIGDDTVAVVDRHARQPEHVDAERWKEVSDKLIAEWT